MLKRGYSLKYRRIYKIWQGIRQRCNNPNDTNSDYSPENCRWATWTQQARNKRIEKINSTGVTGVSMDRGKYRAIIYVNNKKVDLGRHDTLEEAAEARRQGEIKYWGVSA